jgi:hypothetical protein
MHFWLSEEIAMEMDVIFLKCNCHSFIFYLPHMHGLRHILLDYCNCLMMQSYLWQMVRTRATDDDVLNIPVGSTVRGCGRGQPPRGIAPPPHPSISLE